MNVSRRYCAAFCRRGGLGCFSLSLYHGSNAIYIIVSLTTALCLEFKNTKDSIVIVPRNGPYSPYPLHTRHLWYSKKKCL